MLKVMEIFPAIQGEGILLGKPSVFVRFAGCNLKCKWCDTAYAAYDMDKEAIREFDVTDLARETVYGTWESNGKLIGRSRENYNHFVFTGGEPLVQSLDELESLILALRYKEKATITIETNGTVFPKDRGLLRLVDYWSVSPKLSSAFDGMKQPLSFNLVSWVKEWYFNDNVHLKYVVASREDYRELVHILINLKATTAKALATGLPSNLHKMPLIIQPESSGNSVEALASIQRNLCMLEEQMHRDSGFWAQWNIFLRAQQHKVAWGTRRLR